MPSRSPSPAPSKKKTPSKTPPTLKKKSELHKEHFEFGGPIGAVVLPIILVSTIHFLYFAANDKFALTLGSFNSNGYDRFIAQLPSDWKRLTFPSLEAFGVVVAWFLFQVLLERVLPGDVNEGTVLSTGKRLKYNINGHLAFWVSLLVVGHAFPNFDASGRFLGLKNFPLEWIYDNYLDLGMSAMWFSFILSLYLYVKSFQKDALLASGGNTRSGIYNWFIGRELNPREGNNFDWKEFCELRPGLIGWCIINMGCAAAQHRKFGYISTPMLLVNIFQGLYVWDALYSEAAILTTMDITTDGFGFMLAFGDLAWVPFTYSLQARFLVENTPQLPNVFWAVVVALKVLGFVIFRGANGEKDQFRRDPDHPSVKHIKTLETKRGKKLMITGWWGLARKINYTGDWLMGTAWCLTTGFETPVTYFYSIYFFILLVHRALRDDEACLKKYGEEDWKRYKTAVPYIFIPGVV